MKFKKTLIALKLLLLLLLLTPLITAQVSQRLFQNSLQQLEQNGLTVAAVAMDSSYGRSNFRAQLDGAPLTVDVQHGLGTIFGGHFLTAQSHWQQVDADSSLNLFGKVQVAGRAELLDQPVKFSLNQYVFGSERHIAVDRFNYPPLNLQMENIKLTEGVNERRQQFLIDRLQLPNQELRRVEINWHSADKLVLSAAADVNLPLNGKPLRAQLELTPEMNATDSGASLPAIVQRLEREAIPTTFRLSANNGDLLMEGRLPGPLQPGPQLLRQLVGARVEIKPQFVSDYDLRIPLTVLYGGLLLPQNDAGNYAFTVQLDEKNGALKLDKAQ